VLSSFVAFEFGGLSSLYVVLFGVVCVRFRVGWLVARASCVVGGVVHVVGLALPKSSRLVCGRTLLPASLVFVGAVSNCIGLFPYCPAWLCLPQATCAVGVWVLLRVGFVHSLYGLTGFLRGKVFSALPLVLVVFVCLLEWVRYVVRLATLSFRLVVNLRVGHLVLVVRDHLLREVSLFGGCVMLWFLTIVELVVGVVQGFVFGFLVLIYLSEEL